MQQSLNLAMEVQQGLIPGRDPEIDGLDIAGRVIYCDETGGDYYDYLDRNGTGPGCVGIVVGDVAEHGIQSALLMTSARAFLRQRCSMPGRPAEVIADVNRQFTRDVEESGRFMTMFYCEMDMGAREICWVRAGHDPAWVYRPEADVFEDLGGGGLPLGISETCVCEEGRRRLEKGDVIVIGTDGIWEARNPEGEFFGKDRLRGIVRELAGTAVPGDCRSSRPGGGDLSSART